jgi:hypothetical protein
LAVGAPPGLLTVIFSLVTMACGRHQRSLDERSLQPCGIVFRLIGVRLHIWCGTNGGYFHSKLALEWYKLADAVENSN